MKHIEMRAFRDTTAAPVATMELAFDSNIPKFLPKLAEEAGLGAPLQGGSGVFIYENGTIIIDKVLDRDCTLDN